MSLGERCTLHTETFDVFCEPRKRPARCCRITLSEPEEFHVSTIQEVSNIVICASTTFDAVKDRLDGRCGCIGGRRQLHKLVPPVSIIEVRRCGLVSEVGCRFIQCCMLHLHIHQCHAYNMKTFHAFVFHPRHPTWPPCDRHIARQRPP